MGFGQNFWMKKKIWGVQPPPFTHCDEEWDVGYCTKRGDLVNVVFANDRGDFRWASLLQRGLFSKTMFLVGEKTKLGLGCSYQFYKVFMIKGPTIDH